MKLLSLFLLFSIPLSALPLTLYTKKAKTEKEQSKPSQTPNTQILEEDDDLDEQVVLQNITNMLACVGILSTDPYNPAVAGPTLAQIGISFIKIVTQIFKSQGMDEELTREYVLSWFMELPDDEKIDLMTLAIRYADVLRIQQSFCPNCHCESCKQYLQSF